MELYPSDLGKKRYLALLRRRAWTGMQNNNRNGVGWAGTAAVTLTADEVKPSKHPFTSFWTNDLRVRDGDTRAKAASVAQGGGNGVGMTLASIFSATHLTVPLAVWAAFAHHPEISVLLAGAWGAGVWSMWRYAPRAWLQKMDRQALTESEIESLLPTARGTLERQYLALALDVLTAKVPTVAAREEIQVSMMALGEAVSVLPGEPPTHGPTAAVYKNTLLQVSHLRDVVASFDTGLGAAVSAAAAGNVAASIERLDREVNAHSLAQRELEHELGMTMLETLNGGNAHAATLPTEAALPSVPETLVPTPTVSNTSPPPVQQVGIGTATGSSTPTRSGKWWQGRSN